MADIYINHHRLGPDWPVYVVAELSANHLQDIERAAWLVREAKAAGADAVKVQCYDAEAMAFPGAGEWHGQDLHALYRQAAMPWLNWLPKLQAVAEANRIDLFASVFNPLDVPLLADLGLPAYKIASFEIVDPNLIRAAARTGKPLLISTGMATVEEVRAALYAAQEGIRDRVNHPANRVLARLPEVVLLKCTSAYPAPVGEANLRGLQRLAATFPDCLPGLSDHTRDNAVVAAAVALGARVIERHFSLSRLEGGADAAWSDEPGEFAALVGAARAAQAALGTDRLEPTPAEGEGRGLRRSLWVVRDLAAGQALGVADIASLRPARGLACRYLNNIIGRPEGAENRVVSRGYRARLAIKAGTPLSWDLIEPNAPPLPAQRRA